MIDSHCHLTAKQYSSDREEMISRAREAGVSPMVTIADTLEESRANIALCKQHEDIYCTVGVHPHEAKSWKSDDAETLKDLTTKPKVVGVGEIGLDYHYDNSPRDVQKAVFKEQLKLATELNLPVVIHTREAIDDTWEIVNQVKPENIVLHCCSEKFDDVTRFLERGYLLSFTGMITYEKAGEVRDTVKQCPLEQLMIETDAPYLTPQVYRGKRNEPTFVTEVANAVAEIKGISLEEVDRITTENAVRFFGL